LADGVLRSGLLVGPTIEPSGPALVPANLSARQAKAMGLLTSGTYGPPGIGSSRSAALSSSLASRLKARLDGHGSTLYRLTWKPLATPAGRPICLLRASVRPASDNDCSGWPTPQASDLTGGGQAKRATGDTRHGSNLNDFVLLAGWPTSRAEDSESTGAHRGNPDTLTSAARLSGWHTPVVRDLRNSAGDGSNPRDLPRQVPLAAHGPTLTGSSARTGKRGQLNPAHSRWLQGYPREWDDCAATAMPSTRTSPRPSSRRIKKPEGNDVDGGHLKPSRVGQPGND
jgi:hypothetical protein